MNTKVEFTPDVAQMAQFAKAISHPVRAFILKQLSQLDACAIVLAAQ